jgi:hypothetical protein
MNFKEWLINEEGRVTARPTQSFAANRSQLWGPSATFGQPDSMSPIQKGIGAVVTGVGSSIAKELGRDIQAQPTIMGMPPKNENLIRQGVLPLQRDEENPISSQNAKTLLFKLANVLNQKSNMVNQDGQPDPDKFTLLKPTDNIEDINQSVSFTTGLILNKIYNELKQSGFERKYEIENPVIKLQDKKDYNGISFLRVVVEFKSRQIPKSLDDKLAGKGYQANAYEDTPFDLWADKVAASRAAGTGT